MSESHWGVALVTLVAVPVVTLLGFYVWPTLMGADGNKNGNRDGLLDIDELVPADAKVFTYDELREYNGLTPDTPVYVAVKGVIFDVTTKKDMYAPGKGYHVFAGRDASKAMGLMSLKPEDCIPDYSELDEKQMRILDDWLKYYRKRYPIVGKVDSNSSNSKDPLVAALAETSDS